MATNPMQRKARNSFLLGMLVMLLIAGVIIALLFMQLLNNAKKERAELDASVNAYVLNQDVRSGQIITKDMLTTQVVNKNLVPSNATSNIKTIENYALQDKEGNDIGTLYDDNTKTPYLYMRRGNNNYLVEKETETDNYYRTKTGDNKYICIRKQDESVVFCLEQMEEQEEKDNQQILQRDNQGFYFENNRRRTDVATTKEYIEMNSIPLIAKVEMKKNTLITTELLSKSDNPVQDDVRKQEYNMIILPIDLTTGDYVDIRIMLPSGQDYIVVSKKEVEIPVVGGSESDDTIWINLSEDEILHLSCAIIEAYQVKGSKIYATKYTEAGMQQAATPTYPVNESTSRLLQNDPNILQRAMN